MNDRGNLKQSVSMLTFSFFSYLDEEVITVSQMAHTFIDMDKRLVYPLRSGSNGNDADSETPHLYIIPRPRYDNADTFNLLTDHQLGSESRLDVLVCKDGIRDVRSASTTPSQLLCRYNALPAVPVPASPAKNSASSAHSGKYGRGQEFRYISQRLEEMDDVQYIAIMDRGRRNGEPGFLVAEFAAEADTSMTVETTTLGNAKTIFSTRFKLIGNSLSQSIDHVVQLLLFDG